MTIDSKFIIFVTSNKHKAREVEDILDRPIIADDPCVIEVQAKSVADIAAHKAYHAHRRYEMKGALMAEDTGLELEGLGGHPGPYIKQLLRAIGPEGIVRLVYVYGGSRKATATCGIAYRQGVMNSFNAQFLGEVKGVIASEPRGPSEFGFDCIFIPDGHTKTFAEMTAKEKNAISPRALAVQQLKQYLDKYRL